MDRFCVLLRFNFWISFCIELLPLDKPFAGSHVYRCRSCSAHGLLRTPLHGSPLKTKVRPCGAATVGSARPGMFVLSGGVDGGGVGVGVGSQHGVVLGAEHVEQSTIGTQGA